MICAAKTTSNGWQRCQIQQIHTQNVCTVFLLDIGADERIRWTDLRLIDEKWCRQVPFAIRCSLIRMEPASPNDQFTPEQQQQQFSRALQMDKEFYIAAFQPHTFSAGVLLYYATESSEFHCLNQILSSSCAETVSKGEEVKSTSAKALVKNDSKVCQAGSVGIEPIKTIRQKLYDFLRVIFEFLN